MRGEPGRCVAPVPREPMAHTPVPQAKSTVAPETCAKSACGAFVLHVAGAFRYTSAVPRKHTETNVHWHLRVPARLDVAVRGLRALVRATTGRRVSARDVIVALAEEGIARRVALIEGPPGSIDILLSGRDKLSHCDKLSHEAVPKGASDILSQGTNGATEAPADRERQTALLTPPPAVPDPSLASPPREVVASRENEEEDRAPLAAQNHKNRSAIAAKSGLRAESEVIPRDPASESGPRFGWECTHGACPCPCTGCTGCREERGE